MNLLEIRKFFLETGPQGADSYREALQEAIHVISGFFEACQAPYSGLDQTKLRQILAREVADDQLPLPLAEVTKQSIHLIAQHSIIVQHPHCAAHLHTPPVIPALVAEAIISALNQSMDSWDQASAATYVEIQMVEWFAKRFGFRQTTDGTFTSGGTQSNFMGLLLARDASCHQLSGHDVFENGLPDYASKLCIVTSRLTHFSIVKSLAQLGLGSKAAVVVDCDSSGRMCPAALVKTLNEVRKQQKIPFAVVATAGTTDRGAIDLIAEIAPICQRYNVWLHVDATYGGALILTNERSRLNGIELADSIALDFHKFFYQPISCGLFLLRDHHHFQLLEHHADYLNRKEDSRPNLVEKSVLTSRRFDALKIWLTLKTIGSEALGKMFERVLNLTRYAAQKISSEPKFGLLEEPQLSTVLFCYLPNDPTIGETLNQQLHENLLSSGRAIIGRTSHEGMTILKLTLLNPCLEKSDLDALVKIILSEGIRLENSSENATV